MNNIAASLALLTCLLPAAGFANVQPAKGTLLVATEQVGGAVFSKTVILLLHYDEDGAMGLIVNRRTDIAPDEFSAGAGAFDDYRRTLYFGGPVHMSMVHALMRTDNPPDGAERIVDMLYVVGVDAGIEAAEAGESSVRFYMGFAGWAAGQLDQEIARGSWNVVPASHEHVFAEDPGALWDRLSPPAEYRAAIPAAGRRVASGAPALGD